MNLVTGVVDRPPFAFHATVSWRDVMHKKGPATCRPFRLPWVASAQADFFTESAASW